MTAVLLRSSPVLASNLNSESRLPLPHDLRLVLVNGGGYLLQCVQEVACGGHRVSHRQMPVVVGVLVLVLVVPLHHEAVVGKLQPLFEHPLADHLYRETVKFSDRIVQSARRGVLGYLLQTLSDNLLIRRRNAVLLDRIQAVALLVGLDDGKETVPVLRHGIDDRRVVAKFPRLGFQFELRIALALAPRLAFPFERCDFLLQFRLVEQVGVAGEQRHVLREVHARLLVHSPLVDGTRSQRAGLQLRDERLLAVQQVELVAVKRLLHGIDDDVHVVTGKMLGNLVARPDSPSILLVCS